MSSWSYTRPHSGSSLRQECPNRTFYVAIGCLNYIWTRSQLCKDELPYLNAVICNLGDEISMSGIGLVAIHIQINWISQAKVWGVMRGSTT